jgi:hypothetical protein
MFMPISKWVIAAPALLMLAACNSGDGGNDAFDTAEKQAEAQAEGAGKIECALAGAADFARVCQTERIASADGQILVIRHPDGGFRRFNILTDGRGLTPAQGADPTSISIMNDGQIELKSADDRYRLPAKVKSNAAETAPAEAPAGAPAAPEQTGEKVEKP